VGKGKLVGIIKPGEALSRTQPPAVLVEQSTTGAL